MLPLTPKLLVKMFLEMRGYIALLDKKFTHRFEISLPSGKKQVHTHYPSVDIVADLPHRGRKGEIPPRFVGEIISDPDSQGIGKTHFRNLGQGSDIMERRIKLVNDDLYRRHALQHVEKTYGSGFHIVLFISRLREDEEGEILDFIENLVLPHPDPENKKGIRVTVVMMNDIIKDLLIRSMEPPLRDYEGEEGLIHDLLTILNEYRLLKRPRINLNTADEKVITTLPEVGRVLARKIIREREKKGRLLSLESLFAIPGFGKKTVAAIWHLVCFDESRRFLEEEEVPEIAYKLPLF